MEMSKYENKVPYPAKIKKPFRPKNPSSKSLDAYVKDLRKYEEDKQKRLPLLEKYNKEKVHLEELFQEDLFLENVKNDNGVITKDVQRKAEIIFLKAWEDGHANGLYEVAMHFRDLVDLAKELGVDI